MLKVMKKIAVFMMIVIITAGFFISYASYKKNNLNINDDVTYVDANEYISVNYKDGNYFEEENFDSLESIVKHITITNVRNTDIYVTISLMDINKNNDKIKVTLIDDANNTIYNDYLGNMDTDILKTKLLLANESISYDIILTNEGTYDDYGFSCNIMVYKEIQESNKKTFKDTILELNNVIHSTDSYLDNFTDSGLFEVDGNYIFRGNTDGNYVKINDILFRIIRINTDGSVKLISQDNLLNTYYKKKIDGTSYLNNVLLSKSSIIEELGEWYNTYLISMDNYIINSNFCSENSYYLENSDGKYFTSYQRLIENNNPSIECSGEEESYKVGLISADEVYISGMTDKVSFSYLNNGEAFITLTGSKIVYNYNVVDNFSVTKDGLLYADTKITSTIGIRPVITIDKNTIVKGNGTIDSPFEISIQ